MISAGVGVRVGDGVRVAVGVRVGDGVTVGVLVAVGEGVAVLVGVRVAVGIGVLVAGATVIGDGEAWAVGGIGGAEGFSGVQPIRMRMVPTVTSAPYSGCAE